MRFAKTAVMAMVLIAAGGRMCAQADPAEVGRKALDDLLAERYTELSRTFSPTLSAVFTMETLKTRVHRELEGFGTLGEIGTPVQSRDGKITLVSFPVSFSKTKVNIQFHIEQSGQLAAIHFRPADSPLPPAWRRPSYSKPESFHEKEIDIGREPWKLGATLTIPNGKGPFPAVVLVHGPGPNDRDESIRANKVFADIAEGLSSRGIAVLRYDKRTLTYGRQMSQSPFTLREETIDDALAAIESVRGQPEIDRQRIYLLGHSLGGYAAPRIARADGKLAGTIFLAANARPIEDVVRDQTEYMRDAGALPAEEAGKRLDMLNIETEKLKALKPGADNPPVVLGLPSDWLLDVKGYDPASEAAKLSAPLLFLQGERDFQVNMKDFDRWRSALKGHKNATFHSYPDLNHLFVSGTEKSVPAEYLVPANVSSQVIETIAGWIAASR